MTARPLSSESAPSDAVTFSPVHHKRTRRKRHDDYLVSNISSISARIVAFTTTLLSLAGRNQGVFANAAENLEYNDIGGNSRRWRRTGSRLINGTYHKLYSRSALDDDVDIFNTTTSTLYTTRLGIQDSVLQSRERWLRQSPAVSRILDEGNNYYNPNYDDLVLYDDDNSNANSYDDAAAYDDAADDAAAAATDDFKQVMCSDKTCTVNEQCTKFLFGFLEGTTDAKDNCEGIMNAYDSASCGSITTSKNNKETTIYHDDDDFNDDYFGVFYDHQCCSSLRSHYYEYCDSNGILNEFNLLVVAGVMLLCECGKSLVKKYNIRWLPEAGACMLVGMACAGLATFLGASIDQIAFNEEIFMYLLLPPIIFEAALTVNKREFRRRRGAIMVFAVLGTITSTVLTGTITYYSAQYFSDNEMPLLDALVFGSLISSIDPVAILSVLTSLKMTETDTIYILVLGESLLNDGIAITLFKSLVEHYNEDAVISFDNILGSIADFLINACGSCVTGLVCGIACLCYFHLNSSILHPVMEVASFFLWAVVPYWLAEAFDWSGIVAIVVMGFFMDIYLRPGWDPVELELEEERRRLRIEAAERANSQGIQATNSPIQHGYYNFADEDDSGVNNKFRFRGTAVDIPRPVPPQRDRSMASKAPPPVDDDLCENRSTSATSTRSTPNVKAILLKKDTVRLSREADEHVRFVAHILCSLSENAIFAYLGLFLFSSKYEWDAILCSIGITSCILSRAVMVVCASWFIWYLHVFRQRAGCCRDKITKYDKNFSSSDGSNAENPVDPLNTPVSKSARALSNGKVQVVLILAGLRGAVSLALVESVPIYNAVTGVGSTNKPLLKAMTSSSIIFTIFVLGGGAYYIIHWLDITSEDMLIKSTAQSSKQAYTYPALYCGAGPPEMELAATASFHDTSPKLSLRHSHFTQPFSDLNHTLSVDTHASTHRSAGLNSLADREDTESHISDIITIARKTPDRDGGPGLTNITLI